MLGGCSIRVGRTCIREAPILGTCRPCDIRFIILGVARCYY